jgi:uncharacterized delta-60 repeat protein
MFQTFLVSITAFMLLMSDSQLKASSDSVQVGWVRNYVSGYVPAFDFAYSIAIDTSGNVYVTGSSYSSNSLPDFATIKYNSSGDTLWVRRYNAPGDNWDNAFALCVDAAGNVYVTGRSFSSGAYFDYTTIKYNAAGVQQWVANYDGPGNSDDIAIAIALDESGNVYVTGYSLGSGTFYDYATVKYNTTGIQQWVVRYNGPGNTKDLASALAIDLSGNVYVTGASGEGSVNLSDYVTVKYNSSGVEQWVARYSDLYDYATAIAVDASSNVYVTGYSYHLGTYYDYATVKYNASGMQQWVARYNGPGNADDNANAIAIDASGNVYVTGESVGSGTFGDYATVKYSPSGVQQWAARYNGPGNANDVANDIAIDGLGNVYVTGESRASGTEDDFATVKYNASGVEQCVARYNGPGNTFDLATALAVDVSGNIYVTGRSAYIGGSIITTIKYVLVPVSVQGQNTEMPEAFSLEQNYPNPFNPITKIKYNVPEATSISITIYDILGKEVARLVSGFVQPGSYEVNWDATNFTSGTYFYRFESEHFTEVKKMSLVK